MLTLLLLGGVACGESRPPAKAAQRSDDVPANSLSDARLHGKEETPEQRSTESRDPTQPYTTRVGDEPSAPATGSGNKKPVAIGSGAPGESAETTKAAPKEPAGKGAVSRSECDRVMDKYIELEVATNPKLKDVPPEIIEQAKQTAREKHGEAPCTATHAQYTCAMAATSTAAWQRCMR